MKTIYKYPLATGKKIIHLPVGSKILSAKTQRGQTVIYALVETLVEGVEAYEFISVVTGGYADEVVKRDFTFLDTILFGDNQTYVEHVFYKRL